MKDRRRSICVSIVHESSDARYLEHEGPSQPDLATIPGGVYRIGDDSGRPDEVPLHWVELSTFRLARTPVTNTDYSVFVSATGCRPPRFWSDPAFAGADHPVVGVTWNEARAYCAWLSALLSGGYRLPSEAEWEVAARGGQPDALYAWGPEPPIIDGVSLANLPQSGTAAAGLSPANGFGLRDMGFNVHEWCLDWYDSSYYTRSPRANPRGPSKGTRRASRGGAWRHQVKVSRCAARSSLPPDYRYNDYGFRVAAGQP
jgi:sulfatase modifying factor 1